MSELNYRDAMEDDAPELAELAKEFLNHDLSEASMRNLIQDRTIKIVEDESDDEIVGYVSYRAVEDTVVVQHLSVEPRYRDTEVPERLVGYPVEFADEEDMSTRVAVDDGSWCVNFLAETGFVEAGEARFAGDTLLMYER